MQINQSKCLKCGTCKMNCPMQAIDCINGEYKIDTTKCVHCGMCASTCPGNAISD